VLDVRRHYPTRRSLRLASALRPRTRAASHGHAEWSERGGLCAAAHSRPAAAAMRTGCGEPRLWTQDPRLGGGPSRARAHARGHPPTEGGSARGGLSGGCARHSVVRWRRLRRPCHGGEDPLAERPLHGFRASRIVGLADAKCSTRSRWVKAAPSPAHPARVEAVEVALPGPCVCRAGVRQAQERVGASTVASAWSRAGAAPR